MKNNIYKDIFDLSVDGICIATDHTIILCNNRFVKMLGYNSQEEILGLHPAQLSPEIQPDGQLSKDKADFIMKNAEGVPIEWVHLKKSGEAIWCEVILQRVLHNCKLSIFGTIRDISEKKDLMHQLDKSLQEKLELSAQNLDKAQELAKIGSWQLDISKNLLRWSNETYNIFDINKQKHPIATLDDFFSAIHPDDVKDVDEAYQNHLINKEPYIIEHRIMTKQNNLKYVEERCETEFSNDGTPLISNGTIQDITRRKTLENKLKEKMDQLSQSKDLLETIFNSNMHSIAIMNLKSEFILVNDAYEKMTGYTKKEIYKTSCIALTHPDMIETSKEGLSILKQNGIHRGFEKKCTKKDGTYIDVIMDAVLLPNQEEILVLVKDITDEKVFQKQKQLHEHKMIQQSRLAQMGEMISMIAHQWRQPLGAISTTAVNLKLKLELEAFNLETSQGRDNAIKYFLERLDNIEKFVQNLTTTIDDFRNFYKPHKDSVQTTLKDVSLKSLNIIRDSLEAENVEIIMNYSSHQEIEMYDNEIMQVILNIFKNAQDNFLEKNIRYPKIKIMTEKKSISIYDNGGGIQADIIEKIFDPYFSTKTQKNGTGLGLYMSKIIIEEHHNGTLKAENYKDGVLFTIDLNGGGKPQ